MTILLAALLTILGPQEAPPSNVPQTVAAPAKPKRIKHVAPEFDERAIKAGFAGTVVLECEVGADGAVRWARVLQGIPLLNERAIEAVKKWRYEPLVVNGAPSPFVITASLTFRARSVQPEVSAIISVLKDRDPLVREYMARLIVEKHFHFSAAAKPKIAAALEDLARSDDQPQVRAAAENAIAELAK